MTPETPQEPIKPVVSAWLSHLTHAKRASPHTIDAYARNVQQFLSHLRLHMQDEPTLPLLQNLRAADFRSHLARSRQNGASPQSIARSLSAVRNFFRYLHTHHNIQNPALFSLSRPKIPKPIPKALNPNHTKSLIRHAAQQPRQPPWVQERDKTILLLLYGAGLRISEALSINAEQLLPPPNNSPLRVIGKGSKERLVPVIPIIRRAARNYRALCPHPLLQHSPLFVSLKGAGLYPRHVQRLVASLRNQLLLPSSVTPHALRHSFATDLLNAGADLRSLQELLGHASPSSTQIYAHASTQTLLKAYQLSHPHGQKTPTPTNQ